MRNGWMILTALAIAGAAHAQADKAEDQDRKLRGSDSRAPGATAAPRKAQRDAPQTGPVLGPSQASGGAGILPSAPAKQEQEQAAQKRTAQPR